MEFFKPSTQLFIEQHKQIPTTIFKDKVFTKFTSLVKKVESDPKFSEGEVNQIKELFGVWLLEINKAFYFDYNESL